MGMSSAVAMVRESIFIIAFVLTTALALLFASLCAGIYTGSVLSTLWQTRIFFLEVNF